MGSHNSHLLAFSSTKQGNKPCPSLRQDRWRVPTSSCTGDRAIKYPVRGIIIFKGLQFLSTRVALRHYTSLKRLLNQQRISASAVAVRVAALMRQGSLLKLGMILYCGSLLPSHRTKGHRNPCVLTDSSQPCLALCRGHTRPGAWGPEGSKPQVAICKSTGPTTSSQQG